MTNPTLGYLWHRLQGALATSPRAIRGHALADLRGEPPAQGELFNGQKALLMHAQGPSANLPYYLPQTVLALGLAFAAGMAALLCSTLAEPSPWAQALSLALAAVAGVCLWQVLARQGPPLIDRDRYAQARAALARSGDDHARPMHLAMSTAIAFTFLIDGALSGWTVTTEVFGAMLTPRMATVATAVWSLAVAFLLFHMTRAAAEEFARNRRRTLVRNLLASPRPADHQRAEAMIDAVGAELNHDFSQANRTRARWALALVVLVLSAATFAVRINSDMAAAIDAPTTGEIAQRLR